MPSQAFVEVVADTRGVEAQMERELSRIISTVERSIDPIKIQVELELDDTSVNRTLADIERSLNLRTPDIEVRVHFQGLDRTELNASINAIQTGLSEIDVPAQLNWSSLQVLTELARLQAFVRARPITIRSELDVDRNAIARILATTGGAAGAAGGAAAGEGFAASFLTAPTITGLGLLLGPILITALGSIAALGIGGIVAGIAFQGFGDAVAAIISGDQDKIAEAMKGLAPSAQDVASEFSVVLLPVLRDIQDSVQQAFFLPLIGSGTDLANALEKLEPSLTLVADAMGKFIAKLIEILTQNDNIDLFNSILEKSAEIIIRLAPYIGEFLVGALQALNFILSITIPSFQAFKDVIEAPAQGVIVVAQAILDLSLTIRKFITDVGTYLLNGKSHFEDFKTSVSEKLQNARTTVAAFPGYVSSALSNLGGVLRERANTALDSFKTAINTKINQAVVTVRQIPSYFKAALGNLAGTLRSSGSSLIQGFIDGIRAKIGQVAQAAKDAVQAARNYFPFSPAKEGPFSGRGYTTFSGEALIDGFATGIKSGISQLQSSMGESLSSVALTPAAAGQSGQGLASGLVPQQSFESNPNITLIIDGQAIEGAVTTVVEGANARRDRQLVQGVRR